MSRLDAIALVEALAHPNVQAFLRMIRLGEGTAGEDGYRTLFGGELFFSYADHPRRPVTRSVGGKALTSTAAGAYQFLATTWDAVAWQYGLKNFTPKNQDLGAVALIAGRAALADVQAGRLAAAIAKCAKEWASLPGSPYGQPVVSLARARAEYLQWGGQLEGLEGEVAPAQAGTPAGVEPTLARVDTPPSPLTDSLTSSFPSSFQEPAMTPFVLAALPTLIDLVPRLAKLFASDSPTAQRNVAAAEAVAAVAKQAVGASNEQELVARLQADPQAREQAKAAIEAAWFSLDEVGGGIAAARQANAEAGPAGAPFWQQPVFWVSAALMPLVYFVVYAVLHESSRFSAEVQSMVISTVLAGGLGAVTGYWLGTSFSSQRKTDLLAR